MTAAGVRGFKCFLCPSGVEEFQQIVYEDLQKVLPLVKEHDAFLMFHAELKHGAACDSDHRNYLNHLAEADLNAEPEAVKLIIELCEKYQVRCHIVHLSNGDSITLVREARARGLPLTAETCPHYLTIGMRCY